jgi:hypothetical protein
MIDIAVDVREQHGLFRGEVTEERRRIDVGPVSDIGTFLMLGAAAGLAGLVTLSSTVPLCGEAAPG